MFFVFWPVGVLLCMFACLLFVACWFVLVCRDFSELTPPSPFLFIFLNKESWPPGVGLFGYLKSHEIRWEYLEGKKNLDTKSEKDLIVLISYVS